ncbi:sigma-54 interaction domain-containing protein [Melioribacteraceae bacterium 4301-Me]|uniref:sigma-54 interaction domain-containing protein n=1 Tax=Pyranulibacter aquaticus TaxID=3163344 RepID=UPI003597596A
MSDISKLKSEILDSLAEGLFTVDMDFRIDFFNHAAEKITGFKKEEVIGKHCKDIFQTEFCTFECPLAKVLESGRSIYDLKTKFHCKNSNPIPIKLNAAVLKNSERYPIGGVISFRDISFDSAVDNYLKENTNFHGIVGHTKVMNDIFYLIQEIACTDVPVLIEGETGTGKEMIANAIQATSKRRKEKFIKVNCSVLPPNLLASELFGHTKGAFTDAVKDRIGRFELADKGTIFLDEIGEMPLQMQALLLRVIQEGTFERLGESITRKVDVRIIAATNINIKEAIKNGSFREDLYYRLNVVPIYLPPLRARKDDIPFLIKHFIQRFNLLYNKEIEYIEDDALNAMLNYYWPGNIRELENAVEYAFIRNKEENKITLCSLPSYIIKYSDCQKDKELGKLNIDTNQLISLLNKYQWNKTKVAQVLGVNRTTIWRHLKSIRTQDS